MSNDIYAGSYREQQYKTITAGYADAVTAEGMLYQTIREMEHPSEGWEVIQKQVYAVFGEESIVWVMSLTAVKQREESL
jgi:hypothetical protein